MSFILELDAPPVGPEVGEQLERATQAEGYLPVRARRQRRWTRRRKPELRLALRDERDEIPVLSDQADWSESAFTLDERGRELLARTISLLAQELDPGWTLRAYWVGDDCEEERTVTKDELVELIRTSQLNRTTRYRVA